MTKPIIYRENSSFNTVISDLYNHLMIVHKIPEEQLKKWKIKPFINQRALKKDRKKFRILRKQLLEKENHTFSDLVIIVDKSAKTIYILDGGQRMGKRAIHICALYKALKEFAEETNTVIYDSEFGKIKNLLYDERNESFTFNFLCEDDLKCFAQIKNHTFSNYIFTKDDLKMKLINIYIEEVEKIKDDIKKKISDPNLFIDTYLEHLDSCPLGFDDYTDSGLSPQTIYTDIILSGSEHTPIERFEAVYIAPFNGDSEECTIADNIRDDIWKLNCWKKENVWKYNEKRKVHFHELCLITCPSYTENTLLGNDYDFNNPDNLRIISRPTSEDGDRTTLSIENGSAESYMKEHYNTLEKVRFFYKYEKYVKEKINEYCNRFENFKMLFNPSLNKNWSLTDIGFQVTVFLVNSFKIGLPSYSDIEINKTLGLLLNALSSSLISSVNSNLDAQLENKIFVRFCEDMYKLSLSDDTSIMPSKIMNDILNANTNYLKKNQECIITCSDRCFTAKFEIEKMIRNPELPFFNNAARKEGLKLAIFRYKQENSLCSNTEWQEASNSSVEHPIAQKFAENNPNFIPYIHCAGNQTLLSASVNSIVGDKPVSEKLENEELKKFLSFEELHELYPVLLATQNATDNKDIKDGMQNACDITYRMVSPYIEIGDDFYDVIISKIMSFISENHPQKSLSLRIIHATDGTAHKILSCNSSNNSVDLDELYDEFLKNDSVLIDDIFRKACNLLF